jgi:hypothetical protein
MSALPESTGHVGGWKDADWNLILQAIRAGTCTPFLGAGAAAGLLPLGGQLAAQWAREYEYPFRRGRKNLIRVAQYVSVEQGDIMLRNQVRDMFAWRHRGKHMHDRVWPIFSNPDEPHRVLAELNLPLYITTNYDSYMYLALKHQGKRPRREICRWYNATLRERNKREPGGEAAGWPLPTPRRPLVYHLHGHFGVPESMVLTEDDYIEFLTNVSKDKLEVIPSYIQSAFATTTFLFVGYSLEDINFRFLFRALAEQPRIRSSFRHISVQLQPRQFEEPDKLRQRAQRQLTYLQQDFRAREVKVFWGTADEFARELRRRLEGFV